MRVNFNQNSFNTYNSAVKTYQDLVKELINEQSRDTVSQRSAQHNIENTPEYAVDISDEARTKAQEMRDELKAMQNEINSLREQFSNAVEQGEAVSSAMDDKIKCFRIAMRIMYGDKVPAGDHRFLAEKEPDLYMRALSMRMRNENPKKHKRISKDEEEDNASAATAESSAAHESSSMQSEAAAPSEEVSEAQTDTGD